jgi:DNA-binding CsgD family transcriptional regulator
MDLELRDVTLSDLDRLAPLVSPFQCDASEHQALIAMWSDIVTSACGVMALAAEPKPPSTVIHFGCGIFVSDQRADEYHRCRDPFISRRLLAAWIAGERPFLNAEEIARANGGSGLNLVLAYYGGRRDDPRADIANYESSRRALRGWNLRSYTAELFLDPPRDNRQWGKSLGYRVLEYPPEKLRAAGIAEDRAPFIWAATRLDAESNPGYATALLFKTFQAPRLGFTRLEQHLLGIALDGATDARIARAAGMSESAVKKHFRRLYEKARAIGVLEGSAVDEGPAQPTRGVELRRHLLSYLREHPEELRPYSRRAAAPSYVTARSS